LQSVGVEGPGELLQTLKMAGGWNVVVVAAAAAAADERPGVVKGLVPGPKEKKYHDPDAEGAAGCIHRGKARGRMGTVGPADSAGHPMGCHRDDGTPWHAAGSFVAGPARLWERSYTQEIEGYMHKGSRRLAPGFAPSMG